MRGNTRLFPISNIHLNREKEWKYITVSAGDVLAKLERELSFLAETYGVATIGIFGSVSRGEDTAESDVDILVTFQPGKKNIRNYMGLAYYLEELFGRKVDLLTEAGISPYIRPHIEGELIRCKAI